MMNKPAKYHTYSFGTATMYTKAMNIQARYPKERMKEANARGILPFESNSSLGSILHTEIEYQNVRYPAINAHAKGKPEPGQKQGTDPIKNNKMQ